MEKTGPSPVDRRKKGSKHQVITDAGGVPLVAVTTAANVPDGNTDDSRWSNAIPPVGGQPGRPRRRPDGLYRGTGVMTPTRIAEGLAAGAGIRPSTSHGVGTPTVAA